MRQAAYYVLAALLGGKLYFLINENFTLMF